MGQVHQAPVDIGDAPCPAGVAGQRLPGAGSDEVDARRLAQRAQTPSEAGMRVVPAAGNGESALDPTAVMLAQQQRHPSAQARNTVGGRLGKTASPALDEALDRCQSGGAEDREPGERTGECGGTDRPGGVAICRVLSRTRMHQRERRQAKRDAARVLRPARTRVMQSITEPTVTARKMA